ncbi:MAG: hypothetical protein WC582_03540 [Patescibacteria group bacterium]
MENKNQDKNFDLTEEEGILSDGLDIDKHLEEEESRNVSQQIKDKDEFNFEENYNKSQEESSDEKKDIVISRSKIILAKKLLANIKENNDKLIGILSFLAPSEMDDTIGISQIGESLEGKEDLGDDNQEGKIIEGVFDGENMIGPDGKQYSVPANYASKSKLVEGDILKLTITPKGTFVYKQIGPIERVRIVGNLEKEGSGDFLVRSEGRQWRVLPASVTYFKGNPGDETIILIPKSGESKWAAVENIVRNRG